MRARRAAVCIDLDGTLVLGQTISLHLAGLCGRLCEVEKLESEFSAGLITNVEVAEATAATLKGAAIATIEKGLANVAVIDDIQRTVAALKQRGCRVLLATITWRFAAGYFARKYGFDAYSGTEMGEEGGRLDGVVSAPFEPADKVRFLADDCRVYGISLRDCVAIGDSCSDIPLFRAVGLSIALNASEAARAAAHTELRSKSLFDVVPLIDDFLRSSSEREDA